MISGRLLPLQLQVFAAAVLVLFFGWVIYLIRYHRLSLRDSLIWVLSTAAALAITVHPESLRWIADVLHVEIASNALFALALLYVLVNLLSSTIAVSRAASRVRRISQECAILRAEVDLLRRRIEQIQNVRTER